jgi:hypothetical protein
MHNWKLFFCKSKIAWENILFNDLLNQIWEEEVYYQHSENDINDMIDASRDQDFSIDHLKNAINNLINSFDK